MWRTGGFLCNLILLFMWWVCNEVLNWYRYHFKDTCIGTDIIIFLMIPSEELYIPWCLSQNPSPILTVCSETNKRVEYMHRYAHLDTKENKQLPANAMEMAMRNRTHENRILSKQTCRRKDNLLKLLHINWVKCSV